MKSDPPSDNIRRAQSLPSKEENIAELAGQITPAQKEAINDLFAIKKKLGSLKQKNTIAFNLKGIERFLLSISSSTDSKLEMRDPEGEKYDITRTDCVAKIVGCEPEPKDLVITAVHKPIIFLKAQGRTKILQPALVEVQTKPNTTVSENDDESAQDN